MNKVKVNITKAIGEKIPSNFKIKEKENRIIKYLTNTVWEKKIDRLFFAIGLISEDHIKFIKQTIGPGRTSSTKARNLLIKASSTFRNDFRKSTWGYHCSTTVASDKILGIDLKGNVTLTKNKKNPSMQQSKRSSGNNTTHSDVVERDTGPVTADKDNKGTKDGATKSARNNGEKRFFNNLKKIEIEIQKYIEKGVRWLGVK
jgi:hypothetical protein